MQASTNEIKQGMKVKIDNDPYLVVTNQFVKPGKGQAFNRIRLKNILTGRVVEKTYKSGDKLELANVEETTLRLLYVEQNSATFMDDKTFEQTEVSLDIIKDNKCWLKEDTLYEIIFYNDAVVEVVPPTFMELKVTETMEGARGDTASGRVLKPATLETGAEVQIPIFVKENEIVKIDTRTKEYVARA